MDHYADDLAVLTAHLDLKNAIHVGHSTGGGEVVHTLHAMAKAGLFRHGGAGALVRDDAVERVVVVIE